MRLGFLVIGVHAEQVGVVLHGGHHRFAPTLHRFVVRPADHHFKLLVEGALPQARRVHRERPQARHLAQLAAQLLDDFLLAALALAPGLEAGDHKGVFRLAPEADDGQHALRFAVVQQRLHQRFHLLDVVGGVFRRGALGGRGWHDKHAPVFGGR